MKGSSPISKNSRKKGNSSNELSNVVHKSKNNNVRSLLSMWKIERGQQSAGHASESEISTLPPRKKSKVSPKSSQEQTTRVELNSSGSEDLDYCPNCQMPFTALIKQSTNWHITECMDFDYHCLKECPSGAACSSTISSHYMKYSHYSLAEKRSEISKSTKSSPSNEKYDSFSILEEIEEKVVNPHPSSKSAEATAILPRKVELARRASHLKRAVKGSSQDQILSVCKSDEQCIALKSPPGRDKGRCLDCNSSGEVPHIIIENYSLFCNSTMVDKSGLESYISEESKCDLGEHSSQLFQTSITGSLVSPKTVSIKDRSFGRMREEYSNDNKGLNQRQKLAACASGTFSLNKNASSDNSDANIHVSSNCKEEIDIGLWDETKSIESNYNTSCKNNVQLNTICEMKSSGVICSEASGSYTKNRKSVNSYLETACKDNKNNIYSQKDCFDNCTVADDWFTTGDLTMTYDIEITNSGDNCSNNDEIFHFEDEIKKNLMPTMVTKASSENCHNLGVTSSYVYRGNTSKDKAKTGLLPNSQSYSKKAECDISSKKRQTSLMSFFKSSSVKAGDTQNTEPVKSTFFVKDKLKQTKNVIEKTKVESNFVSDSKFGKNIKKEKTQVLKVEKAENSGRPLKKCPFYKKIPDTTFCVDAFSYGSIPGIRHYFLSHFHYDHYGGLKRNFQHPLYCSVVTANLVSLKIRVSSKFIHILKLNESIVVDNIEVTALDANHCPGSVMFLFRFPDGRNVLHTGDFRAIPEMELYPSLQSCVIETLYLDTTYCNPRYDFPSQDSVLDLITSLLVPRMKSNVKLLVACGSYTIGKERAFMAVAERTGCKIWAQKPKLEILKHLEDQQISSRLVTNPTDAKIHVLPMNMIKLSTLQQYLLKFVGTFDEIIGLKPTGWEHNSNGSSNIFSLKPISQGPVTIYGIPYSEHSSFSELKNFVQFLRPRFIIPTVNVGSACSRNQMESYFKQWSLYK